MDLNNPDGKGELKITRMTIAHTIALLSILKVKLKVTVRFSVPMF